MVHAQMGTPNKVRLDSTPSNNNAK